MFRNATVTVFLGLCLIGCSGSEEAPKETSGEKTAQEKEVDKLVTKEADPAKAPTPRVLGPLFQRCPLPMSIQMETGPRKADRDIRCTHGSFSIGDATTWERGLVISGPTERHWEYAYSSYLCYAPPDSKKIYRAQGTYEIKGDLAIFTGTSELFPQGEICFGVNYGFVQGNAAFNAFFPAPGGGFRWHRKWFRKVGSKWKPLAERSLTIWGETPKGETWTLRLKGEGLRWDEEEKLTRKTFEHILTYKKRAHVYYLRERPVSWIPSELWPFVKNGRILAINAHTGGTYGFGPSLSRPPPTD